MSRRLAPVVLVTVLATACANPIEPNAPLCDRYSDAIVLSEQALPGIEYVPCINALPSDWAYRDLTAKSGESVFAVESSGLGTPFLDVTLVSSCDTSGAVEVASDEPEVPLFVDVQVDDEVVIVVIPDTGSLAAGEYASVIRDFLGGRVMNGRTVRVEIDGEGMAVSDRVERARQSGSAVLVVSARDAEEHTATLILPGDDREQPALPDDVVIEALEEAADPPTYTGAWFYPFSNGCVIYEFDAHGTGLATIEADVQTALALFDAEAIRSEARDAGYTGR
jgi:hypothetical protein